jgi:hypothetical protein
MAKHRDTLLGKKAYAKQANAPMVNLTIGGQNGYQSDLRYFHANTDYIRRNVIAKLVEAPSGFLHMDAGQEYINALKAIVELHAQSWEGLNKTLTVASQSTAVSGAGEMQETPSNVTRERSVPSLTIPEKYGMPVSALMRDWITGLIMDPDSKVPGITTLGATSVTDLLPDVYSMTVLFFEPDPTFTKVQRAWLIGNMYPTTGGEDTGRRDKTQDGEQLILSIPFTGVQQVGYAINQFAQKILDSMTKTGTNPNQAPAFIDTVDANVVASLFGYTEKVNEASRSFIRP